MVFGSIFTALSQVAGTIVDESKSGMQFEEAAYPSYQEFLAFSKKYDQQPSFSNLFSVHFSPPRILQNNLTIKGGSKTRRLNPGDPKMRDLLNLYCQQTRIFFERWVSRMVPDANQMSEFYDNYVCPALRIYKWERGGGDFISNDAKLQGFVNKQTGDPIYNFRKHKLTAMYEIRNLFPYNIGSTQLNNDTSRAMTLTVGFLYERYRVAVEDDFTDDGRFKFRRNTSESQNFLPNLVNTGVGDF